MSERFDIAPGLRALLQTHGLIGLEPFFQWSRGQRLDKKRLESWRQRWCMTLADDQGRDVVLYLKRFDRPPLSRQFQRWRTGQFWQSSAAIEWSNSRQLMEAGIPAASPAAFGESMCGPFEIRSFILLQQVQGESLERIYASPERAGWLAQLGRRRIRNLFDALADLIAGFHREGFVHRDLYLSHIFLDTAALESERGAPSQSRVSERVTLNGAKSLMPEMLRVAQHDVKHPFSIIDLQRVFKPRWRARRWVVKDLAALHFSTPAERVSESARLRFLCRYVRTCGRFGSARQLTALIERKTQWMRRRALAAPNSANVSIIPKHNPRHAGG